MKIPSLHHDISCLVEKQPDLLPYLLPHICQFSTIDVLTFCRTQNYVFVFLYIPWHWKHHSELRCALKEGKVILIGRIIIIPADVLVTSGARASVNPFSLNTLGWIKILNNLHHLYIIDVANWYEMKHYTILSNGFEKQLWYHWNHIYYL